MKQTSALFILVILFSQVVQSQTLLELKKDLNISNETETIIELTEQAKSHYANGVDFPLICKPFYLIRDLDKGHFHILANCANELIHEEFKTLQSETSTSFQPENNSTWVLGNSKEWVLVNLDIIRTQGWSPVRIPKNELDSIFLLDEGHFLTMKGNQKWHNTIDINGKLIANEVFFEGNSFLPYYGGLIVPIKEGTATVYRYVQYQQFLFWDDELQDNVADPHFNYLKSDGYFKADAILIAPQEISDCNAVIKLNNELKVYSFCDDKIIEEAITHYTQMPFYGILVLTEDYVAFGNEWKRINCKHPIAAEIENFGDIFNYKITMKDGSSIKIEFPSGEIVD